MTAPMSDTRLTLLRSWAANELALIGHGRVPGHVRDVAELVAEVDRLREDPFGLKVVAIADVSIPIGKASVELCPWWGDQCLTTAAEHARCNHDPCVPHRLNREKYERWEPGRFAAPPYALARP